MSPVLVYIDARHGKNIEIVLDRESNYYGEWIEGEGADICLYRDQETNRVVGCRLPCYAKSASFWYSGLDEVSTHQMDEHDGQVTRTFEDWVAQQELENDQPE